MNGMSKNEQIRQLYRQGLSVPEIAQQLGVRYQRVYQVVKNVDRTNQTKVETEAEPEYQDQDQDQTLVPDIAKCLVCGQDVDTFIHRGGESIVCPNCLRELTGILVQQWNSLSYGTCEICGDEYEGITTDYGFFCTDCISDYIRTWFKPAEE